MPLDDVATSTGARDKRAFWMPIAPSANNLFVNAGGKKRILSNGYAAWRWEASIRIRQQNVQPLSGKSFQISIAAPINRTRDLDNIAKATIDLIVDTGLLPDDRWIDSIRLDRVTPQTNGGTEMWVTLKVLS